MKVTRRLLAGYAAIVFILPYLAIKVAWIAGVPVGMPDKNLVADSRMIAINVLTFGMDAVAILLALAFTHRWGLRVPAGPLLFPMWVGSGFLAPIAIAIPAITLVRMLGAHSGQPAPTSQSPVEPWVAAMVFSSFVGQGLALMMAFILYVRERWNGLLRTPIAETPPPRPVIVRFGNAAATVAMSVGLLELLWAAGAPLGLSPGALQDWGANFSLRHATFGFMALAAAAGIVMLVNRLGRPRLWIPLSLAWIGSGSMFCWGAWLWMATAEGFSRSIDSPLLSANNVVKTISGLAIGAQMCLLIAASARARRVAGDFTSREVG